MNENTRAFSREGLDVQPHMAALQRRAAASPGYTPATTPWRPLTPAPEYSIADSARHATPGAFLSALVLALGWPDVLGDAAWEQTTRVWSENDESAVGVVLQWGFLDDAVAGRDLRVTMRRVNNVWHAEKLEQRSHCRRKVDSSGTCA